MTSEFRSYAPSHSSAQLAAQLERRLGSGLRSLTRLNLGSINAVYQASFENGLECFVKVAPASRGEHRLREEVWAFEQCRRAGVPTPELIAFEPKPAGFPEPFHVTRALSGVNGAVAQLQGEARWDVLRQLGGYLARIHTIELRGFGLLEPDGDGFRGRHATLWENLSDVIDGPWWRDPLLAAGLVASRQLHELQALFERNRHLFQTERACLVWADAGLKNLVVDGATVTGIVDLENVVAGEPVNDFDALHCDTADDVAAVKAGYGTPELFDDRFERKLKLYQYLFAFPTLAHQLRRQNVGGIAAAQERIRTLGAEVCHFQR